jgi:hypothetical protein
MTSQFHIVTAIKPEAKLADLLSQTPMWDAEFSDRPVGRDGLKFNSAGVCHDGLQFDVDEHGWERMLGDVGAPTSYFSDRSSTLKAMALAEHVGGDDLGRAPKLILRDNKLFSISRGDLINLPVTEILTAIREELGTEGESLTVARIDRDAGRLEVDLVSPTKAIQVRRGDIVRAGIHILHDRYGKQATVIEAYIYRLLCLNGMTRRECPAYGGVARTRRLPVGYPKGRELQLNQVRCLTRQHWNGLQSQLEEMRASSDRAVHVEELLARSIQRARISARTMMPRLLAAWELEGSENTYFGAVNALTRVATHDRELSRRQRRMLAALGGLLAFSRVHLCPRCYSVLTGDSGGTEDVAANALQLDAPRASP